MSSATLRLGAASLAFLCAACGKSAKEEPWVLQDAAPSIGVSLSYPADFKPERVKDTVITHEGKTFTIRQMRFRSANSPSVITVLKSEDQTMLAALTADHPVETVTIGGKELKKFTMSIAGNPTGFILQETPVPIIIAFSFMSDGEMVNQIMDSVNLLSQTGNF